MTPNTRTLKGQSYCSQRWANPVWPKGSKSRGFSSISEMGCINGGEASLKEIASYCYKVFGVQAKGCYNIYNDIKMRKSESRTYFLDRAAEKVNKRMLLDEERERQRR